MDEKLIGEIRLIPAVSRVLVEYERLYNGKQAREMFEILARQIARFIEKKKEVRNG